MRQKKRSSSSHHHSSSSGNKRPQARNPLLTLWEQWTQVQEKQEYKALDRWLRGQMRHLPAAADGQKSRWTPLLISAAMIEGVRYQQSACALEDLFTGRAQMNWGDNEWQQWDEQWNTQRLTRFQPLTFWSWIERRLAQSQNGQNWGFSRQQRDDDERNKLLSSIAYQATQQPLSAIGLLWQGLRPGWISLLNERAQKSGWTDENLQRFINMQNEQPPLWLRINPLKAGTDIDLQDMLQVLRNEEINVSIDHDHLNARGGKHIDSSELYKSGQLEIQDLASQQIAAAVNALPGDKIWDCCAGAGGKTLAIAGTMNNKGALIATDLHQYKLNELKRRVKRAGASNVRTFSWDGRQPLRLPQEIARQNGFDKVLVDAPCSSAGTWRRNPDARWRFSAADTEELNALQLQLLSLAAQAVRPGGLLVYATCSWSVAENEKIAEQFLAANPPFTLENQKLLGAPDTDSDTMFITTFVRQI